MSLDNLDLENLDFEKEWNGFKILVRDNPFIVYLNIGKINVYNKDANCLDLTDDLYDNSFSINKDVIKIWIDFGLIIRWPQLPSYYCIKPEELKTIMGITKDEN